MTREELLVSILKSTNEILTAANVIIAASLLLYNLTRNLRNRVARSSAAVLASVTFAYLCDAFISLGPDPYIFNLALRLQWLGIAFIPSAMFHLADTLLATTGLPSRGRRRRVVRILYIISMLFTVTAVLTDALVITEYTSDLARLHAGPLFPVFIIFFITVNIIAFLFVDRARRRGLTRASQRRMAYLQIAILTPALGIFPFSALLPQADVFSLNVVLFVNIANLIVIMMLIFLSYPLSFFGSDKPDRVVKVELLRFLLRGPGTGMLALATIIFTTQATDILGLSGEDFTPFAVVAVVLLWQWTISLSLPYLEKRLIYNDDSDEQIAKLQNLSDRILTHSDLTQLIDATLQATSDYFRIPSAFVATYNGKTFELTSQIGNQLEDATLQNTQPTPLDALGDIQTAEEQRFYEWQNFQITPLFSQRQLNGHPAERYLIGIMGIKKDTSMSQVPEAEQPLLASFIRRTQQTLDDLMLQTEIFAALEGLLPQISTTRSRADALEYRPGRTMDMPGPLLPSRDEMYEQVRAALRHYWGGPGISRSRLMEMSVVQDEMEQAGNPTQALRNTILKAIDRLKPEGERSMFSNEWIIYNILDLRFIEGKKVKEVTKRLSMSDADFYRKQRVAIDAITDTLLRMENENRTS